MAVKQDPRLSEPLAGDGPGAYLRKTREEANISVDKVALVLRLRSDIVVLIEADAYDRLPAPTFVRGYLRSYARVLGIASKPVLEMYDRQGFEPPPLTNEVTESTQAHTSDTAVRLVTYAVAVVLALLVGLWWHSQEDGGFGITGDLFDWSPDSGRDPLRVAAVEPGTAPVDGDAGGESVAMVSHPAHELAQGEKFPAPLLDGDTDSGDSASDDTAPSGTEAGDAVGVTAPPPLGVSPADGESTATSPARDAIPGDVAAVASAPTGAETEGDVAGIESTPAGVEAEGESVAMTPSRPSPTLADEESALTSPVEEATPGDIVEVEPATSAGSIPETTADREASAVQEAQPEAVAALGRTSGADPVVQPSPGGADGADAPAPEESGDTDTADASASASLPDAPAPETAGAATDPGAGADSGTAQSGLVLAFMHESWVEVYDRERARLFFGLVQPGRVLSFDGPQPFDVLLGFGQDVRVAIDGQAFDHTPFLKHGVARFSIGAGPADGTDVAESADTTAPDDTDTPATNPQAQVRGG